MKKMFLIVISLITLSAASQAQDSSAQHKAPGMRQQKMDMMQQLNLTNEQKTKFKKMHEDEKTKIDSIQNSTTIADDQKQAQIKTVRMSGRKAMEDMLTPEQKTKMMQMHSQQTGKKKAGKEAADSTE